MLAFALLAVFIVTSALLGSLRTGTVVVLAVFLTVVNVMGIMGVWGVSLNPLSLVNLVISVGIAVEFCAHVARAFMGASGGGLPYRHPAGERDRDERAWQALVDVGSSVRLEASNLALMIQGADTVLCARVSVFAGRFWDHDDQAHWHLGLGTDQVKVTRGKFTFAVVSVVLTMLVGSHLHNVNSLADLLFQDVARIDFVGRAARSRVPSCRAQLVWWSRSVRVWQLSEGWTLISCPVIVPRLRSHA